MPCGLLFWVLVMLCLVVTILQSIIKPEAISHSHYINQDPLMGAYAHSASTARSIMQKLAQSHSVPLANAAQLFPFPNMFEGFHVHKASIHEGCTILQITEQTEKPQLSLPFYRVIIDKVWESSKLTCAVVKQWQTTIKEAWSAFHIAQHRFSGQPVQQDPQVQDVFEQIYDLNPDERTFIEQNIKPHYDKTLQYYEHVKHWKKEDIQKWRHQLIARTDKRSAIPEVLSVLIRTTELVYGYKPRATQLVSVLSCLLSENTGRFLQVKTGEGKTLITAMLACAQHLVFGIPVDIVSSSTELARRDALEQNIFYTTLGILSGCITDVSTSDEQAFYKNTSIIYGAITDFMSSIVSEMNTGHVQRGTRPFASLIIDELDSSLVDCIRTILRLSTKAPGAETLLPVMELL